MSAQVVAEATFPNDPTGFVALLAWLREHEIERVGLEGSAVYGVGAARHASSSSSYEVREHLLTRGAARSRWEQASSRSVNGSPVAETRAARSDREREEAPGLGDPLELVDAAVLEAESGSGHEILHGARHEDLSRAGE